MNDIE